MKNFHYKITPITLPIILFAGTIAGGTLLLHSRSSLAVASISWLDALFTATSAVCVTGLVTLDTGTTFSLFGQSTILFLIQLGGIGIMTYTALIYYLIRQRVALNDRFVIGQGLQHDRSRPFGKLLVKIVLWTVIIEIIGALLLNAAAPRDFTFFTALFHSVSAFCNAGFSLYQDSLSHWHGDWGVNLVVMLLIVAGGLGFAVVVELNGCLAVFVKRCRSGFIKGSGTLEKSRLRLSWYSKIILFTTFFLIVGGGVGISFFEYCVAPPGTGWSLTLLTGFFQSVTCRTAGFNTIDLNIMTNVSLYLMIILMFIGGGSGSCAGGLKVGTFRVLIAFLVAQLKGRSQAVIGRFAVERKILHEALVLLFFSVVIIFSAAFLLNITEGGLVPHPQSRDLELKILFETVSAFATVGLSLGLTAKLSAIGKIIIILLMFTGRLGPIIIIAAVQSYRQKELFRWPEERLLIG
ncbi:MAG: potassium transporter TrkH [Deltaproteobacteria bacterium]|nr:potassium transporter TrkH [Candidatus Tharpella sp.]